MWGFIYDYENEAKFANRGLSSGVVDQILDNELAIFRNRKRRRGLYLVIGRDHGGGYITVPIEKTAKFGYWRPITAWRSKQSEIIRFHQQVGGKYARGD